MRCKKCSTTWKLSGGDGPIGNAAPGHFVIVASILAAIALVLAIWLKSAGSIAVGIITLAIFGMSLVGCGYKQKDDPYQGSECPECGEQTRILPWHF